MAERKKCECGAAPKLIFPCSGASDTGEITDRAARKLTAEGAGKMFCLAGIGGRVSGILTSTQDAAGILVIDGCHLECARKTLEQSGFSRVIHLCLTDLGFKKGETPPDYESIGEVVAAGKKLLKSGCCP